MSRMLRAIAVGIIVGPLCAAGVARGGGAPSAETMRAMFDAGWQKTFSAREEARQQYVKLQKAAPGDLRVEWGYLLVLLRQSRYPEAIKQVDAVLAIDKKDRMAWQVKAWLAAITKEYDASMACMQRVAELLPVQENTGDAELPYRESAAFLGRLNGFFESAVEGSVDDATLAQCRQRIAARLTTGRQEAFDQARRGVVRDFVGAAEEAAAATEANEIEAAQEKERTIADLKRKVEETYAVVEEAQTREEKARETRDYEISKISSAEASLTSQAQRVQSDYITARDAVRACDARITECAVLADQENDPGLRQHWLNEIARWRIERGRRGDTLAVLDRQLAGYRGEAVALQRQRAEAEGRYQREAAKVNAAAKTYDKTRAQLGRAEGQTVTGVTGGVRGQKKKAVALTSHVPLPLLLDAQRDKILESLK